MNRIYLLLFWALCTCTATATSYTVNFKSSSGDRVQITTETNVADLCASDKDYISSVSEVNNVYQTADGILFDGTSGEASLKLALNSSGQKNAISYVLEVVPYSGEEAAVSVNSMEQTITKHTTELKFRFSQPTKEGSLMIATKNNARFCLKSLTVDYVISNEIAFQDKNYTIDFGETFEAPILFKGVDIKDVKYTSSSKYVAEVNAASGAITVRAPGSAVITASATDPNNTSASVSACYTLNLLPKQVPDGEDVTVLWNFNNVEDAPYSTTVTDVPIINLHGDLFGVWYINGKYQKNRRPSINGLPENRAIVLGESGNSFTGTLTLRNSMIPQNAMIKSITIDAKGSEQDASFKISAAVNGTDVGNETWSGNERVKRTINLNNEMGDGIVLSIHDAVKTVCIYGVEVTYVVSAQPSPSTPTIEFISSTTDATPDRVNLDGFGEKKGDYFEFTVIYNESEGESLNYSTTCYSTTLNGTVIDGTEPKSETVEPSAKANAAYTQPEPKPLSEAVTGTVSSGPAKFGVASCGIMKFSTTRNGITSEEVSIEFNGRTTGVESLTAESNAESKPQYFSLQGVQITFPTPGIYIVRQGNRVTKRIIR